jgi:transcriptional antiterminator RfaH
MIAGKSWYVVYSKPRQEGVAQTNLVRQGYEVYLPRMRQVRKRQGRRVSVAAPMFPRYLFIHLDTETDNWGPIRSTLGVVSIVRFGQVAVAAPDDLVALLRAREDASGLQVFSPDEFQPGERVRVTDGSLAGYQGVFLARSGRERVVVLLDILGRQTRTSLDAGVVEPTR